MRIKEALEYGAKKLYFTEQPRKEAALLMSHLLNCDRKWLLLNEEKILKEAVNYFSLVERRVRKEPLEYILGKVSFYSKTFLIDEGVLIPRPETELLIEEAKQLLANIDSPNIIEVGTGSGAVSIVLALLFPKAKIIATDINLKAILNAKKNAALFGVEKNIIFVHTSYMDGISGYFHLLVSNPPYIANNEELDESVLNEPHAALFGGARGDEILQSLLWQVKDRGDIDFIACEMGYDQKEYLKESLKRMEAKKIRFYKDLAGHDRGFVASLKGE